MALPLPLPFAALLAALLILLAILLVARRSPTRHLPPGPPPIPVIGNILQIPAEHPEEAFAEWAVKYGSPLRGCPWVAEK